MFHLKENKVWARSSWRGLLGHISEITGIRGGSAVGTGAMFLASHPQSCLLALATCWHIPGPIRAGEAVGGGHMTEFYWRWVVGSGCGDQT